MSQIPSEQSKRIEMTGWFKHYFPGNLRRNKVETRLQLQMSGSPWGLIVMWAS